MAVGRQALHPPKPLAYLFRNDENIGGGGIALQALLLTLWVCTPTMLPYNVFRFISIKDLTGIDMVCFDKKDTLTQIIMILASKFPNVRLQITSCCR